MKNNTRRGFSSPLIIIAIVVLASIAGGVYFYTNNKEKVPVDNTDVINVVSTEDIISNDLSISTGIIITSINSNDLVKLPITIEGYLDGKGWTANEGEIGVVEVFDANGKSISNLEIIETTTDWLKYPVYFKTLVGDRQMMSYITTDTGVVKITSKGAKDGEQLKSVSIPVRFK